MCDPILYKCRCGRLSEDRDDIVRHVEEVHVGEFDVRDLDATEKTIRERITPSPLEHGFAAYLLR